MKTLLAVTLVGGLVLVGCKKEEPKPVPPATPAPTPQAVQPAPAAPAQDALKDLQKQGQTAVDSAVTQGRAAVDSAAAQGKATASDLAAQATQKLDEAVKYIKENKLDLAEKAVSELESRKASFPAAVQQRVGDARKLLEAAKVGNLGGLSLPKL